MRKPHVQSRWILAVSSIVACTPTTAPLPTPTCSLASLTAAGPTVVLTNQTIALTYAQTQNSGSTCTAAQLVVVWTSGTSTVATVSQSGQVTGITPGVARISVTSLGMTAFVDVQVNPTPVATILIAPGALTLTVGQTQTLSATCRDAGSVVTPCNLLVWSMPANVVATISPGGLVTALAAGTVTATATVGSVTAQALVTVNALPAGPSRIAYAVAELPAAAAYTADPALQFNGLGGPITVDRSGPGQYTVTIPGFGGAAGESRTPFVSALNSSSVECLAVSWTMIGVTDATVRVDCSSPGGILTDSKFTVFAIGQGGLPGRLAFASSGPVASFPAGLGSGFPVTLGSASAWSSSGLPVQFTRFDDPGRPTGRYLLELKTVPTLRDVPVVRPTGATTARCQLSSWATVQDIACYPVGSASFADAPFSGMLLDRGRDGERFGAAHSGFLAASVARNSAGGANTVSVTGAGTWRVTFANLGRGAGDRETVLVTPHALFSAVACHASSWTTVGNDLLVDVACFTGAGAPLSATDFVVVVIE